MQPITIRPVRNGDEQILFRMAQDGEPGITANKLMIYFLASSVLSRYVFIGEVDQVPIGYLFAVSNDNRPSLWLHQIVVGEKYRGLGYGEQLLHFIINTAKDNGMQTVELMVKPDNRARRLYDKVGFKEIYFDLNLNMYVCCKDIVE